MAIPSLHRLALPTAVIEPFNYPNPNDECEITNDGQKFQQDEPVWRSQLTNKNYRPEAFYQWLITPSSQQRDPHRNPVSDAEVAELRLQMRMMGPID